MNSKRDTGTLLSPGEIERRSFAIIEEELGDRRLPPDRAPIIKRVIHTTADFSYLETLAFTPHAVENGLEALHSGAVIVTDTNMALAGVNRQALAQLGCRAVCFMAEEEIARAAASMDKAAQLDGPVIYAIGNAPTALLRLCSLLEGGMPPPALVIGAPVGFVNVVESKERLLVSGMEAIVARGRKGGSAVAAAICNALLYSVTRREEP